MKSAALRGSIFKREQRPDLDEIVHGTGDKAAAPDCNAVADTDATGFCTRDRIVKFIFTYGANLALRSQVANLA